MKRRIFSKGDKERSVRKQVVSKGLNVRDRGEYAGRERVLELNIENDKPDIQDCQKRKECKRSKKKKNLDVITQKLVSLQSFVG